MHILARGEIDWTYIVAIIILSLVSWIGNAIKKRAEKSRSSSSPTPKPSETTEQEDYAEAEALPEEMPPSPLEPERPVIVIQRVPLGRPSPSAYPPPLATPVQAAQPPPPPVQTPWSVRETTSRGVLQGSPTARISATEAPTLLPSARQTGTLHPALRVRDRSGRLAPPQAPPQESSLGLEGMVRVAPQEPPIVRRFRQGGIGSLREAVLIAEILGPPLAARTEPPECRWTGF